MLAIVKKDAPQYLISLLLVFPLILVLELLFTDPVHPLYLVLNNILIYFLVLGPVMINEQREEKCHGYQQMAILPLRRREIILAKFLPALLAVIVVVGVNILLATLLVDSSRPFLILRALLLSNGAICLAVTGVFYAGIFRLGYTRFVMTLGVLAVAAGLVPSLMMGSTRYNPRVVIPAVINALTNIHPLIIIAIGIGVYTLLLLGSISLFSYESKPQRKFWL